MSKLTELKIKNLSELGKYSDGNGLFFGLREVNPKIGFLGSLLMEIQEKLALEPIPQFPLKRQEN